VRRKQRERRNRDRRHRNGKALTVKRFDPPRLE